MEKRELLEAEIKNIDNLLEKYRESILIHEVVRKGIMEELKTCPTKTMSKEEKKNIKSVKD
jgi:hypothetical protein